jgi:2-keto-4-pentenoate hydratase
MISDRDRYAPGMERQLQRMHAALDAGMPRRGWKIGINVPEVLASLELRHSGVGWLDGHRVLEDGERFTQHMGARIAVEPELCIHISEHISGLVSPESALERIAGVSAALELVDYAKPGDFRSTRVRRGTDRGRRSRLLS